MIFSDALQCHYMPCPWAWTPTQGPWISQFWEKSTWTSWNIPCIYFFYQIYMEVEKKIFLSFKHISIFTLLCKILHNKDWEAGKMLIWSISFNTFSLHVHIGPFLWPVYWSLPMASILVPSYGLNLWSSDHNFHNLSRGLYGHHACNFFPLTCKRRGDYF